MLRTEHSSSLGLCDKSLTMFSAVKLCVIILCLGMVITECTANECKCPECARYRVYGSNPLRYVSQMGENTAPAGCYPGCNCWHNA